MKTSYVDVVVRVKVTHGVNEDPMEVLSEANCDFSGEGVGESKVVDAAVAGTCGNDDVLIREDGQTGRSVSIHHDPPVE